MKNDKGINVKVISTIPDGIRQIALQRAKIILAVYGDDASKMPLENLVASGYLSGFRDAVNTIENDDEAVALLKKSN